MSRSWAKLTVWRYRDPRGAVRAWGERHHLPAALA